MIRENKLNRLLVKTIFLLFVFQFGQTIGLATKSYANSYRIAILMASDNRQERINGFKEELARLTAGQATVSYETYNAAGDRQLLLPQAEKIVASAPDLAIAAGGLEADALKQATEGKSIPVVFLTVASAVKRGLGTSMSAPGGNLTGIDANYTELTAKRLWYAKKILPEAKKITIFSIPSITPSAESAEIARQTALQLDLELTIIESEDKTEIAARMHDLKRDSTDLVLLLPAAPVDQLVKSELLPVCLAEKIPIMGYSPVDIDRGAFATYGSSLYENGKQAAALALKVLYGENPGDLPIEPPSKLFLTLNRGMVQSLGLALPTRIWELAEKVVDVHP